MTAQEQFRQFLKTEIAPELRAEGFRGRLPTLLCESESHTALVNFQKRSDSSRESVLFTVNLGVASKRLLPYVRAYKGQSLTWGDCQWTERLNRLSPTPRDEWWTLDCVTDIDQLGEEIRGLLLGIAIPHLKSLMNDEALRLMWERGESQGLTEFGRLHYLAVLVKELGAPEAFEDLARTIVQFSKGKRGEDGMREHLMSLGWTEQANGTSSGFSASLGAESTLRRRK
jgi:hypothetical protein